MSIRAQARQMALDTGLSFDSCRARIRRGDTDAKPPVETKRTLLNRLRDVPCADCGEVYPVVCMDFHHRPDTVKHFAISQAIAQGIRKNVILEEVSKCDVICANCHRIRHWSGRNR